MRILITGATGLVGKELGKALVQRGHQIIVISRNKERAHRDLPFPCEVIEGDLLKEPVRDERLKLISGVINLLGENIGSGRWTEVKRQKIYDSRIKGTQNLLQSLNGISRPEFMISTSAVGFYGHRENEELTEVSSKGQGFLSDVCQDWEKVIQLAESKNQFPGTRFLIFRLGMVLSSYGGAFQKMITPFRMGVGGQFGSGLQWMSWIHIHDLIKAFVCAVEISDFQGVFNIVAPEPITNREFTKTLAHAFGKKTGPCVPRIALKLVLGQMSELVLFSQKVSSLKLQKMSFYFKFPTLEKALQDIVHPYLGGNNMLYSEQYIPAKKSDVFQFFANAHNLKKITPSDLDFHVLKMSTSAIQSGTLIEYQLKMRGIPLRWRAKFIEWNPCDHFTELQEKGPYSYWRHEHIFEDMGPGTLMIDRVQYRLPFGLLGGLISGTSISRDMQIAFQYRRQKLSQERFLQT
ncbi:MAG: hypothetical protein BroJett040_11670 [Oligoflexia bacterium]|nr:MAG: hypothetical protein BroJett040_11670 [Oligoflexia bacterium]